MTCRYVVRTGGKRHGFRHFSTFINARPYTVSDPKRAAVFQNRETAEHVAKRCTEYTGQAWKVVDLKPVPECDI